MGATRKPRQSGQAVSRKAKDRHQAPVLGDDEDDFALELEDLPDQEEDVTPVDAAQPAEDPPPPGSKPGKQKKKRRRQEVAEAVTDPEQPRAPEAQPSAKAEKRKAKKRQKLSGAGWSAARAEAAGIAAAPAARQAEWLWTSFESVTGATFLEREGLDEGAVVGLAQSGSLEERLFAYCASWRQELAAGGGGPGAPVVLVLAASAAVANSLAKLFPTTSKGCRVAKLFAKHFKVEEQQKELQRPVAVASGTPNRVDKLADLGSLSLGRLQLLLLDAALDAKERSILDIPEVRGDFWQLFRKHLKGAVVAGRAKIALIDSSKLL